MPWPWWIWVLVAYFGINILLTASAAILMFWQSGEPFYAEDIWAIIRGLFLALPMVVISLINAWIDR